MARKIVIDTGCLYRLGSDYKALDVIKKSGFKYFDLTLFWKGTTEHIGVGPDYKENAIALRKYADKIGLKCVQSHGYFTTGIDERAISLRLEYLEKDIEIASILGAKSIVIHPIFELSLEDNVEFFRKLIPFAHKHKIIICIENIFNWKTDPVSKCCSSTPNEFCNLLDTLNDEYVKACLDIGHAEISDLGTSAIEMIHALKNRLYCLHIHDTDLKHDNHQLPYTNNINFEKILDALREENYKGNITFEVETCYNHGNEIILPFELYQPFIKCELAIGKYFKRRLDE